MVVDYLGKEHSKVDIVMQVYFSHKLGYDLQLEVAPQLEASLKEEFVNQK
jgi:hypothetical protein